MKEIDRKNSIIFVAYDKSLDGFEVSRILFEKVGLDMGKFDQI